MLVRFDNFKCTLSRRVTRHRCWMLDVGRLVWDCFIINGSFITLIDSHTACPGPTVRLRNWRSAVAPLSNWHNCLFNDSFLYLSYSGWLWRNIIVQLVLQHTFICISWCMFCSIQLSSMLEEGKWAWFLCQRLYWPQLKAAPAGDRSKADSRSVPRHVRYWREMPRIALNHE